MSKKKKKQSSNQLEVQNAVKTLFANMRFMSPDDPIKSVVVTSSVPNEGKSVCSVELARAIATSGNTVLLVEGDMRRRTLASSLGVHPSVGMYAVLTGSAPLTSAIVSTTTPGMYFLDTEPNIPNPADIIASKRYRKLTTLLAESYDYVIYDTPPVGTFVDAAILSTLVDGTVMVVKPGSTKRADLMNAYDQLVKADANVLGICATFCEGSSSEYYYAYYTNSGERVKDGRSASSSEAFDGYSRSAASAYAGRLHTPSGGAGASRSVAGAAVQHPSSEKASAVRAAGRNPHAHPTASPTPTRKETRR